MLYGRLLPMAASVGCLFVGGDAFVIGDVSWATAGSKTTTRLFATESAVPLSREQEIQAQKKKLLKLLGPKTFRDPVLADPITKEAIEITATNALLGSGGGAPSSIPFVIQSPSNTFRGSSDTYLDLLEPVDESSSSDAADADASPMAAFLRQAIPYIPAPFRGVLSSSSNDEVIPMRDLFTSPAVSFAYERGWRQNFNAGAYRDGLSPCDGNPRVAGWDVILLSPSLRLSCLCCHQLTCPVRCCHHLLFSRLSGAGH